MTAPFRAVVSGLRHGRVYCDAFREDPDCELAGFFDPDGEKRAARQAENPAAGAFDSYEEMLAATGPDLVAVASPEFAHADQALKALDAGCHVLLEKAMARTHDELEAILEAVVRTGKLLYVGQEARLTPAFLDARRLLREGALGEVYQAWSCYMHNCEYLCTGDQFRGSRLLGLDAMLGGGCHPVDLLRSLLGEVEQVFACRHHLNDELTPHPDATTAMLRFAGGASAVVEVTVATRRPYYLGLRLNGTRGYYEGDNSGDDYRTALAGPTEHAEAFTAHPTARGSHDCAAQVRNLLAAIRGDGRLMVDAWEGANSTSVCLAAVESAATGKPVAPRHYERPASIPEPLEVLDAMD